MKKRIAVGIIIVLEILSMFCLIWVALECSSSYETMLKMKADFDEKISSLYIGSFIMYLSVTIAIILIMLGNGFIFVYIFKNNFTVNNEKGE